MAPTPIEDIDFPALSDKILELLCALWTFVSDLCITLWSYVSQAFWSVWTYPPFETFRNELVATLIALVDYVIAHPLTTMAICILVYIFVPVVLDMLTLSLLHCLDFRERGMLRDSYAVNYQSTSYGRNVPRSSTLTRFQPRGARGSGGSHNTASPSWS